ncbi:MAG TPA: FtsX-like permease family protein [Chthoniobacterales bacterium]|jgi:putative ABC transport system permease protein
MNFPTALRLFYWQVVRYALRHKLLASLNIASIALGVAVYLAIQIANHSADRALRASVDLVAGKASLEVRGEMAETLFPAISKLPGVTAATPLVEAVLTLPEHPGEYLRVLGIDPFSNQPFATFRIGDGSDTRQFDFEKWLTDPAALAISRDFASKYRLKIGEELPVLVNSRRVTLRIAFIIDAEASLEGSGARIAAMDIASAQTLFGLTGKITAVQVLTAEGEEKAVAVRIQPLLPATVTAAPPAQRNAQVGQMLQAFQLNLSALSMVALLVGMFLVFNTVSASVVRRRREIGILRSGGVSRGQIRALFLGEALLYGVFGLILGSIGGVLLSNLLVAAVGTTISSLYILLSIDQLFVSAPQILLAVAAGLGSVLLAAWVPANEAALLPPVVALNPGYSVERPVSPWLPLYGLALVAVSVVAAAISLHRWPWLGFGSAFLLLTGCSLFAPALTAIVGKILRHLTRSSLILSLAAQNLQRSLARISLTVAALSSAVAMMIGVSVMIYSFRQTINTWVTRSLVADVFIAPASNETIGLVAYLPPSAASWLRERPEVTAVDTFREMRLPWKNTSLRMSVVHGHRRDNLRFLEGDHAKRNALLFELGYVLISEPLSRRHKLKAGDSITLPTPEGPRTFDIGGTYYDYTSDEGTVLMARENFDPLWDDLRIHSLAVYLRSPNDYNALTDAFREKFGRDASFSVYSNASIRQRIFEIFEQTFAVTSLLRIIAIGVAVIGIFLTLSTLVTERIRELAVLRSIGAGRRRICQMILAEGALVGLLASILGVLTGCGLAVILTFVVNKAFFGWTIQFSWPLVTLLTTPLWIVPAAIASALIPAWRASRLTLAPALRNE